MWKSLAVGQKVGKVVSNYVDLEGSLWRSLWFGVLKWKCTLLRVPVSSTSEKS